MGSVVGASLERSDSLRAENIALVAQLLRLAGFSVLLFGAGFRYLVELHEAGRLDRFRIGHFLLLALTYSLFFAVFAVLGSHEVDAWIAVTIPAVVSYPLLVLHVSTIAGLRFAITSALPLAMLTTGIVVNGVYGNQLRSYVYLSMLCVVIALLTLTYPRLARGQEARRAKIEHELTVDVAALAPEAAGMRSEVAKARAPLALQDPVEHGALRQWVEHRLTAVAKGLEQHEHLLSQHDAMRSAIGRAERTTFRVAGTQLAGRLAAQLPQARAALQEAAAALAEHRQLGRRTAPEVARSGFCVASGQACATDARYCPSCGVPCAEARTCRRCDVVLRLPLHSASPDRRRTRGDALPWLWRAPRELTPAPRPTRRRWRSAARSCRAW